jgi:serine/threonine protein kinase
VLGQLISEIKIQSFLDHPNLIKLYDFFCDEQNVYLFLELASDGQLFHLMDLHGKFTEESVSLIIRELAEGIKYMHSKSIIHRDIKLENIVFTHVRLVLFREWQRYVILDGLCTSRRSSGRLCVELLCIYHQKYLRARDTTKRSIFGLLELWLMSYSQIKTLSE